MFNETMQELALEMAERNYQEQQAQIEKLQAENKRLQDLHLERTKFASGIIEENKELKELVIGVLNGDNMNLTTSTKWLESAKKLVSDL